MGIAGSIPYLRNDIAKLLLHFLLGAIEPLPKIIAHTASLQQIAASLFGRLDLDETLYILDGSP